MWWKDKVCPLSEACPHSGKDKCKMSCVSYYLTRQYVEYSGLPKMAFDDLSISPEQIDMDAFMKCKEFKDNILEHAKKGQGLYIYGRNKGNGKTTWSYKILLEYMRLISTSSIGVDKEIPIYYVNVCELFEELKSNMENKEYTNAIEYAIENADIVVFDDIGVEAPTTWVKNKLYAYINKRYNDKRSMIFTSNLSLTELGTNIDSRIADRISGVCRPIHIQGASRRFTKNWWDNK